MDMEHDHGYGDDVGLGAEEQTYKARTLQLELEVKRIIEANHKYEDKMFKMRMQRDRLEGQVKGLNEEVYRKGVTNRYR